mmetsp:Transcript_25259/g.77872  ORF Transcript_25259/g.77872 Transcript_25259/m.77872 type:complete len:360 (+) Transcript_25259:643-1722(+)
MVSAIDAASSSSASPPRTVANRRRRLSLLPLLLMWARSAATDALSGGLSWSEAASTSTMSGRGGSSCCGSSVGSSCPPAVATASAPASMARAWTQPRWTPARRSSVPGVARARNIEERAFEERTDARPWTEAAWHSEYTDTRARSAELCCGSSRKASSASASTSLGGRRPRHSAASVATVLCSLVSWARARHAIAIRSTTTLPRSSSRSSSSSSKYRSRSSSSSSRRMTAVSSSSRSAKRVAGTRFSARTGARRSKSSDSSFGAVAAGTRPRARRICDSARKRARGSSVVFESASATAPHSRSETASRADVDTRRAAARAQSHHRSPPFPAMPSIHAGARSSTRTTNGASVIVSSSAAR